jgi:hypothetical protein
MVTNELPPQLDGANIQTQRERKRKRTPSPKVAFFHVLVFAVKSDLPYAVPVAN